MLLDYDPCNPLIQLIRDSDTFLSLRNNLHDLTIHPLLHQRCITTDVCNINVIVIGKHLWILNTFYNHAFGADVIGMDHE